VLQNSNLDSSLLRDF